MNKRLTVFVVISLLISSQLRAATIVVDHTAVDKYSSIPQQYIDEVKKMWVTVPGESHSLGYRIGLRLLQTQDSRFAVNVPESGTPEAATTAYLRFSRATWGDVGNATGWRYGYGEEDWYTSQLAIDRTKAGLLYCKNTGPQLTAIGFGWCWDMTWMNNPGGGEDLVYRVHWAGSSAGGPDGNLIWGLDAGDLSLTNNHVSMDTYLNATQQYIDYCAANNLPTKVFFTTGPIEGPTGENGYQRYLKHTYLRNYINTHANSVLFDYADILSWSNAGVQNTTTWTDHGGTLRTYQHMHSDNMKDLDGTYVEDGDHIGQRGAVRLAKAMWWMLARLAGWDGGLAATTTTISGHTPNPSTPGATVTVTYTVTSAGGTPTGNVTVSDGVDSCTGTVAAGSCQITLHTAGSRNLTASYAGDSSFAASTSASVSHTVTAIRTLTVNRAGSGTGTVTSSPSGINCGATCSFSFTLNSTVNLTPFAAQGSVFTGFSGACTGAGLCQITMDADKTATANFNLQGQPTGYYPVTPCRVFDTREAGGTPLEASSQHVFLVVGTCTIPATAKAVAASVTVVNATAVGDLEIIAGNLLTTSTSTISVPLTRARANNAMILLATNGNGNIVVINNTSGTVHFILDVNGYFR